MIAIVAVAQGIIIWSSRGTSGNVPRSLETIPSRIGTWVGEGRSLAAADLRMLGTDNYVWRTYRSGKNAAWIDFFAVEGDKKETFHSPGVCLMGDGWVVKKRWSVQVPDVENERARQIPFSAITVRKGAHCSLVMYIFNVDGTGTRSLARMNYLLLKSKLAGRRPSGAMIRITVPLTGSTREDAIEAIEFAAQVYPMVVARMAPTTVAASSRR